MTNNVDDIPIHLELPLFCETPLVVSLYSPNDHSVLPKSDRLNVVLARRNDILQIPMRHGKEKIKV
jgi:hypothetical protein